MAVCIEIGQMSLIREENQYKTLLAFFRRDLWWDNKLLKNFVNSRENLY